MAEPVGVGRSAAGAKGKRYSSSYGNARKSTVGKAGVAATATAKKAVVKAPAKKAVTKKAVAK